MRLPAVADGSRQAGTTVSVPVTFPAVTGKDLTITVTGVRLETTPDYAFQGTTPPISLPLGIAELGIPGTRVGAPAPTPSPARAAQNLLDPRRQARVGGAHGVHPSAALQGDGLTVTPCGADAAGINLAAGSHVVLSAPGTATGIDIDQLALDSAPGGTASPRVAGTDAVLAAPAPGPAPAVRVVSQSSTLVHLHITGATHPYWLVLGESINKGWKATVDATGQNLGPSSLIDGFGNGWLVQPNGSATMAVTLRWTPQSKENVALLISALAVLACFVLALVPRRRSRRARKRPASGVASDSAVSGVAMTSAESGAGIDHRCRCPDPGEASVRGRRAGGAGMGGHHRRRVRSRGGRARTSGRVLRCLPGRERRAPPWR